MRTSASALELDFTEPSITAARAVADTIARNGSLTRETLLWAMETAYGCSSADGRWSLRDAYDMLELAQVLYLEGADLPTAPLTCLAALTDLVDFPLRRYPHDFLPPRVGDLRHNLTAYDAVYVALAEALDATLLTRDRRLAAASGHRARVEVV